MISSIWLVLVFLCVLFFGQVYAIPVVAGYTTYLISFPIIYVLFFTILFVLIFFRWFLVYINWVLFGLIVISIFLLFLFFLAFGINDLKGFILLYNFIVSVEFLFKFIIGFIFVAFLFLIVKWKFKIFKLSFLLNLSLIGGLLFINIILGFEIYKLYILDNESNKYIKILIEDGSICGLYDVKVDSGYIKKSINEFVYNLKFKINKSKVFDKDVINLLNRKGYYSCYLRIYYGEPKVNYLIHEKKFLIQELDREGSKINITFGGELGWYCDYCINKILNNIK